MEMLKLNYSWKLLPLEQLEQGLMVLVSGDMKEMCVRVSSCTTSEFVANLTNANEITSEDSPGPRLLLPTTRN